MQNLKRSLHKLVYEVIEEQLKQAINKTIGSGEDGDNAEDKAESLQMMVASKVADALNGTALDDISPKEISNVMTGDDEAIAELFQTHLGLHPAIAKVIIALIKQDKPMILEALGDFAKEVNTDPEIGIIVGEIALDSYNPD